MNKLLDSPGPVFILLEMKGVRYAKGFPEIRKPTGIFSTDQYDVK